MTSTQLLDGPPVEGKASFLATHSFSVALGVLQVALLLCYGLFAKSSFSSEDAAKHVQLYNYLVGVTLMMLVGFGYLMTFLRWYGLGAVGLTMLVTCVGLEVSMLVEPLFAAGGLEAKVNVGLGALLNADFAVAAFLISFGGLIGKVGPTQLVLLVVCEAVCYSANKQLVLTRWLDIADCGGTIVIHMFGAYFGLTASFVLGRPTSMAKESASAASDVSALIGTTFLWLYWPSFVAGALPVGTVQAELALTNTVLALLGSTVCTFVVSPLLSGAKIRPVDIQNATLAGGVSIGAVGQRRLKTPSFATDAASLTARTLLPRRSLTSQSRRRALSPSAHSQGSSRRSATVGCSPRSTRSSGSTTPAASTTSMACRASSVGWHRSSCRSRSMTTTRARPGISWRAWCLRCSSRSARARWWAPR